MTEEAKQDLQPEQYPDLNQILGEPVFIMFEEETLKVRRNLMVFASIVIIYQYLGLDIEKLEVFGVGFKSIENGVNAKQKVDTVLVVITFYLLAHFIWQAWDACREWKLRLSGYGDYKKYKHNAYSANSEKKTVDVTDEEILSTYRRQFTIFYYIIAKHVKNESFLSTLFKDRFHASMERFEKGWSNFQKSQVYRFIILEMGIPVSLALSAIIWLGSDMEFFKICSLSITP